MVHDDYSLRDDDEGSSDGANERGTYTPRFGQTQPQLEVKWKWAAGETDGGLIDLGTIWNSSCVEIQPGLPGSGTGYDKVKKWKVRSASMWNTKPLTDTRDYSSSSIETEKTFNNIMSGKVSDIDIAAILIALKIKEESTYINLGDWMTHYTYAVFNGKVTKVKKF